MVKLGEDIIMNTNTHPLTKDLVGNDLKCTNCHLNGGKAKTLGTFIGTAAVFPAFSKREGTLQTLQNRINNCFMRSMGGTRPTSDTEVSLAMATYITWLSEGVPMKMNTKKPVTQFFTNQWPNKKLIPMIKKATNANYVNGKNVYDAKCAMCHGVDGKGIATFPPVWGDRSYNTGAGMSKLDKMATWVKHNMPLGNPSLTDQEAVDVTIYVDAQKRPDFNLKDHLPKKDKMGYYNSKVFEEKHTVESNFKAFGLDLKTIRGEK